MYTQEVSYYLNLEAVFGTQYRSSIVKNRTHVCIIKLGICFESYIFKAFQF